MTANYVFGTLQADGRLYTASTLFTLYNSSGQPLQVDENAIGKHILVHGHIQDAQIHAAILVDIISPLQAATFAAMADKGILQLEDITPFLDRQDQQQNGKVCALVIGHKKESPGAQNAASGRNEFEFNDDLAQRIERLSGATRIQRIYRRTLASLPSDINELNPDFTVSLHCNAFNSQASGTEVLYYHTSETGRQMAALLQNNLLECLGLKDRGIKARNSEERGGYLLRYTNSPCLIAEPFFIDNNADLATAVERIDQLAQAYRDSIENMATILGG